VATGNTTTDALADSLPTVIAAARIIREYEGVMPQLVDVQELDLNTGLSWNEVSLAQLTAQNVTETTVLNNPQQMSDALFSITPSVTGIHTFTSDRVAQRISKKAWAKTGALAMNAIMRKKDEDGLVVLDGATTSLCGAGNTLASGHIRAAAVRITSNPTEPANSPLRAVLHGFQLKDIEDELTASLGTYELTEGETARVFKQGFRGTINNARVYEDGNITIDGSDDAKGGVFARDAIVLVQGIALRTETRREPDIGGGGTSTWIYDEYAYGERSAGNWLYEIYSDCTVPTA
jgi:hypothetical protein